MINVNIDSELNIDNPICQYMRWRFFEHLLADNLYTVTRKKYFCDPEEKNLPLKKTLPFSAIGEKTNDEQWLEYKKISDDYKVYGDLPTACWSDDIMEKEWKWNQYAGKDGVCIISSIRRLQESLSSDKYVVNCKRIKYAKYRPFHKLEEYLFIKDIMYRDDSEIRFYFTLLDSDNDIDISNPTEKEFIRIDVDPKRMLDYVILSPFIPTPQMKERCSILQNKGIVVKTN